jgi:hypothetical protein
MVSGMTGTQKKEIKKMAGGKKMPRGDNFEVAGGKKINSE